MIYFWHSTPVLLLTRQKHHPSMVLNVIFDTIDLLRVDKEKLKKIVMACCGFGALVGITCIFAGAYLAVNMVKFPNWGEKAPETCMLLGLWMIVCSLVGIVGANKENTKSVH